MTVTVTVDLVGTCALGMGCATSEWFEPLHPRAAGAAIASAYWDRTSCQAAADLADRVGGSTRLLLWTAGASRAAWEAARREHDDPRLDVRFVDSPSTGGIFHVKLAAIEDADGSWLRTLVGSANLTAAAYERNLELGVAVEGAGATEPLRTWFYDQFEHALPAEQIDWDTAVRIAPERSEANERRKVFAAAALASPARVS